jgi:hypothetical protein
MNKENASLIMDVFFSATMEHRSAATSCVQLQKKH